MIVNIPLQIDEKVIQDQLSLDYEQKIQNYIFGEIKNALYDQCGYYSKNTLIGMTNIIRDQVDKYLEGMRDEIIEAAAERLADRLSRTKKAKELLDKE